jgi:hypothetical protein
MAKKKTDNTMAKRTTDNTMAKRKTDNTMARRKIDNTMAKRLYSTVTRTKNIKIMVYFIQQSLELRISKQWFLLFNSH